MTEKIEEATRKQVAEFLPRAIEKVLASYYEYMENPDPPKSKSDGKVASFKDYHLAGKVAVSHIKLLLDLARWAEMPVGNTGEPVRDLSYLMVAVHSDKEENDCADVEDDLA